jgi:hypothetical protein
MAAPKQSGYPVTIGAAILLLMFSVPFLQAEFVNPSGNNSQAALEATSVVGGDSGQAAIEAAEGGLVTSAAELDAIRLEIIELRRFVVIIGGIFFGWICMAQLFRAH